MIALRFKDFGIGLLIILVSGTIFSLSYEMLGLFIPSLLFAGVIGGIYVGIKRKRPMFSCIYDGFTVSVPASILLSGILALMLWYYHEVRYEDIMFIPFFFIVLTGSFLLTGIVGGAVGGLGVGLYYRYLKKDRGEMELYETYMEEKTVTNGKKRKELSK